jgi:hypothetical protein
VQGVAVCFLQDEMVLMAAKDSALAQDTAGTKI